MTVEEIAEYLERRGWYLALVKRNRTHFAYAKRRVSKDKWMTKYLKTERKFHELTPSFIEAKISLVGLY